MTIEEKVKKIVEEILHPIKEGEAKVALDLDAVKSEFSDFINTEKDNIASFTDSAAEKFQAIVNAARADINAAKEAAIEDITKAAEAARVIPQQREG